MSETGIKGSHNSRLDAGNFEAPSTQRDKWKVKSLCIYCGDSLDGNSRVMCTKHLIANRVRAKKHLDKIKQEQWVASLEESVSRMRIESSPRVKRFVKAMLKGEAEYICERAIPIAQVKKDRRRIRYLFNKYKRIHEYTIVTKTGSTLLAVHKNKVKWPKGFVPLVVKRYGLVWQKG